MTNAERFELEHDKLLHRYLHAETETVAQFFREELQKLEDRWEASQQKINVKQTHRCNSGCEGMTRRIPIIAGTRVVGLATWRPLCTVDRVLENGDYILITDSGSTVIVGRGDFAVIQKPRLTLDDQKFLRELRVRL